MPIQRVLDAEDDFTRSTDAFEQTKLELLIVPVSDVQALKSQALRVMTSW